MKRSFAGGISLVAVGITFVVLGSSGQRAFLPIGATFIVIGTVFMLRRRRPQ